MVYLKMRNQSNHLRLKAVYKIGAKYLHVKLYTVFSQINSLLEKFPAYLKQVSKKLKITSFF